MDNDSAAELRLRFPAFQILREVMRGRRRARYIARRTRDGVHPHTLVTTDLAELRDELSRASQPPGTSPPGRNRARLGQSPRAAAEAQACDPGQRKLRLLTGPTKPRSSPARRAALMRDLLVSAFPGLERVAGPCAFR